MMAKLRHDLTADLKQIYGKLKLRQISKKFTTVLKTFPAGIKMPEAELS